MARGFAPSCAAPARMPMFDPARILRASSIRYGRLRVRGVPAILAGAAAIVFAAGTTNALRAAATSLPDVLRGAGALADALSANRRGRLNP
ncbi:MAG: hypothetical protein JOZ24_06895 [Candidatus Eremiobacteraeota bacterium]|nr:hypothetical protein [Candidatus Eremiobacteraeota bacterium]